MVSFVLRLKNKKNGALYEETVLKKITLKFETEAFFPLFYYLKNCIQYAYLASFVLISKTGGAEIQTEDTICFYPDNHASGS